jgi:mycofactocin biosynthetic radical S-adenosylmethionine protein MftC
MMLELFERIILKMPVFDSLYRRRSARLKRHLCLFLAQLGILKPFSFVQWLATNRCNAACPFCESSSGKAHADELNHEEARTLIRELHEMKVRRLIISGGEPLMRPDLCEIMEYANQCNIALGLVTNGWLVPEMESRLLRLKFFLYFTSIDGEPAFHNSIRGLDNGYERALKGLGLFTRMRVPVRIVNTVVHSGNILQLESMAKVIANSGATAWRLTPASKVGRAAGSANFDLSREQLSYLASFIMEKRKIFNVDFGESHRYLGCFTKGHTGDPFFCGAGLTRCSIMPNGAVMGCHQVFTPSFSEGNIRDISFRQIWKHGFARFRKKDFRDTCLECDHLDGCQGGCWAEMERTGSCLKSVWHKAE